MPVRRWWREEGSEAGGSNDGRYNRLAYLPHLADNGMGVPENEVNGGGDGRGADLHAIEWLRDYMSQGGDPWVVRTASPQADERQGEDKGGRKVQGEQERKGGAGRQVGGKWDQREWQKVLRSLASRSTSSYQRPFYAMPSRTTTMWTLPRCEEPLRTFHPLSLHPRLALSPNVSLLLRLSLLISSPPSVRKPVSNRHPPSFTPTLFLL
jgi:hypothetical protein